MILELWDQIDSLNSNPHTHQRWTWCYSPSLPSKKTLYKRLEHQAHGIPNRKSWGFTATILSFHLLPVPGSFSPFFHSTSFNTIMAWFPSWGFILSFLIHQRKLMIQFIEGSWHHFVLWFPFGFLFILTISNVWFSREYENWLLLSFYSHGVISLLGFILKFLIQ